ncbi:MAG: hypothetical protein SFU87_08950 [Chitinophagaceae bacterium]|nr:hypothetical protein [Chitinophagaceae bacterium]
MRNCRLTILFIVSAFICKAQTLRSPAAARYLGAGAYSKEFADVFSVTANQAALAEINTIQTGVYGERRFLNTGINFYSAIIAVPSASGNFAVQADYSGYKNYNETQFGIAYARRLAKTITIGAKFNYYNVRIPVYGSAGTVNFEIGSIWALTPSLRAGFHVYNPVGGSLGKNSGEKLSSAYKAGLGYEFSKNFFTSAEIVKEETKDVNINIVMLYHFAGQFFLRCGIATETSTTFIGIGYKKKNLRLDAAASYHQQLGLSPGLMLLYSFPEKENE